MYVWLLIIFLMEVFVYLGGVYVGFLIKLINLFNKFEYFIY